MNKISWLVSLCLLTCSIEASFRFVVCGDSRGSGVADPYNTSVLSYIYSEVKNLDPVPAFMLFGGDMVYAGASADGLTNYIEQWKNFTDTSLGSIPYYTAVGNRDLYQGGWPPKKAIQNFYLSSFTSLPGNGPTSPVDYRKLVYSFEYGSGEDKSLFVVLDAYGFPDGSETAYDNDYDDEQISWFASQAANNTANHKFVMSHGPAFSPEGWPVGSGAMSIWNIVEQYNFEVFYCGHEHIYARWAIDKRVYPLSYRTITQILTGGAGAPPDAYVKNSAQSSYFGYNYVVVDVDGNNVIQHAYKVVNRGDGTYYSQPFDSVLNLK